MVSTSKFRKRYPMASVKAGQVVLKSYFILKKSIKHVFGVILDRIIQFCLAMSCSRSLRASFSHNSLTLQGSSVHILPIPACSRVVRI